MQLIRKTLAFGQLPSSKGDLYVPDSGRKGFVHNVELHNANTSAETVVLNYHDGSSEEQLYKVSIDADDTVQLDFRGEGSVVDDGAKITGSTTTATQVTYKLSGTEEIPDGVAAGGGGSGGRLIWEWNETDVTQFGDGDGTPNAVTGGPEAGTLAVATLSSPDTDASAGNVLLYTHTGGTADVFYTINDLPTMPERYIVVVQMGPRNGSSYGLNTIPSFVPIFQDATHFMRVGPASASSNDFRMFTGNGDVGSAAVSSYSQQLSVPAFSNDAGIMCEMWCMLTEPSAGVDPQVQLTWKPITTGDVLDVKGSTHGWTAQGGATAPSTSWDSGWQSGGTIRQPGLWFREQASAGKAYFGMMRIYEV